MEYSITLRNLKAHEIVVSFLELFSPLIAIFLPKFRLFLKVYSFFRRYSSKRIDCTLNSYANEWRCYDD